MCLQHSQQHNPWRRHYLVDLRTNRENDKKKKRSKRSIVRRKTINITTFETTFKITKQEDPRISDTFVLQHFTERFVLLASSFHPGSRKIGPKWSMVLGACPYVLMVGATLAPSYYLSVPMNIAVGFGSSFVVDRFLGLYRSLRRETSETECQS